MSEARTSFENIILATKPYFSAKGEVRLGKSGIGWKPISEQDIISVKSAEIMGVSKETGLLAIQAADIKRIIWQKVARGYGIRILLSNGSMHRLENFDNDSFDELKTSVSKYFHGIHLETRDMSVKGWNWGKTDFEGTNLTFKVDNKPMFDIPMEAVTNSNLAGKNEVSLEIKGADRVQAGTKRKLHVDELVEIRFYVPGTAPVDPDQPANDGSDGENEGSTGTSAAQVFYETVKSKADIGQIIGSSIVTFNEVLCLTPRGRYTIDMFKNFLRLRGKTYDYKILFDHISRLFLVTKPDGLHVILVISLSPPIRQGQTRYPYLVFQFLKDDEKQVVLNLDNEQLQQEYNGSLRKRYDEPLYKIVSELFCKLTNKHLNIPDSYETVHGANGVKCSLKANEGLLYPLDKGLLFVPKPTQFFPYSEISSIVFTSREEYNNLFDYLKENGVSVISDGSESGGAKKGYAELSDSDDDGVAGKYADNDDEGDSSPDEDFVAHSESEVGEEFNEDYETDEDPES
ncbi:FACT complex subunit POB3 [Smittium mucronatum]|uniref:FACT complex subunit POB3 n=1 Tax=Smittium mucronatum TaxID=133383 RepID=A0A1R0H484_9FUNG|nr:FACT complex subunit POB3 [Smittium mucronatum]